MKIAEITPDFKRGESADLSNYQSLSVLPCFSKILERLMYNWLQKHFIRNNSLSKRAIQLIMHYYNLLTKFTNLLSATNIQKDLPKAFDTVEHNILLKKLEIYGISGTYLQWFRNYLGNRKQYIQFDGGKKRNDKNREMQCFTRIHFRTSPFSTLCQRSSVRFRSSWPYYVADDTNLLYSDKDINTALLKVNDKLQKIYHLKQGHSWIKNHNYYFITCIFTVT